MDVSKQKCWICRFYDIKVVFFPDIIKKLNSFNVSIKNNPSFSNFKNSIRQIPTKPPF